MNRPVRRPGGRTITERRWISERQYLDDMTETFRVVRDAQQGARDRAYEDGFAAALQMILVEGDEPDDRQWLLGLGIDPDDQ